MQQTLIYTTENNNTYIYDNHLKLSLLTHPEVGNVHAQSPDVDPYYVGKYAYLKRHGFFAASEPVVFGVIDEEMVKAGIIQTLQIVFEVTDGCNLKCTYCGFGELYQDVDTRHSIDSKKINTLNAIKLLKYIFALKHESKNNTLRISFYGGEPLLNMPFIKRIVTISKELKSRKEMDIGYSMTTNATLIHKHIDFLAENDFHLLISLDGNEANHSYRVFGKNNKNSFRKVIENIDRIQRDYPEYFKRQVSFNAVLHNRNSVKEIYEFIYTRYHKIPQISELNGVEVNPDNKDCFESMFHSKQKSEADFQQEESELMNLTHEMSLLHQELHEFIKYYSMNCYAMSLSTLLNNKELFFPASTCLPFARKIFLTTRNQLLPCERIRHKYAMGKVDNDVVLDIQEITRQYTFWCDQLKKVCRNCYAYRCCGLCMFGIDNLDKLDKEGFRCGMFYDQKRFEDKLSRISSFLEKKPKDYFRILENTFIT